MRLLIFLCLIVTFCCVSYETKPIRELKTQTITVRVRGEVEEEEVLELEPYSTVEDVLSLIELTENADLSTLNECTVLKDGDVIYIPEVKENVLVSINTATKEELMNLPGVGESTALRIIEYREKNGFFQVLSDLMKVKGIGESKYAKLKDFICL